MSLTLAVLCLVRCSAANYCKSVTPISKESDLFTCNGEISLDPALCFTCTLRAIFSVFCLSFCFNFQTKNLWEVVFWSCIQSMWQCHCIYPHYSDIVCHVSRSWQTCVTNIQYCFLMPWRALGELCQASGTTSTKEFSIDNISENCFRVIHVELYCNVLVDAQQCLLNFQATDSLV